MWHGSTGWDWCDSHNLNLSNRPVRTRMPGGVAGERPMKAVPYADYNTDASRRPVAFDRSGRGDLNPITMESR